MNTIKPLTKKIIIAALILVLVAITSFWYIMTVKFTDTNHEKSEYTVNAIEFIREFKKNDSLANKKYAEKIVTVSGTISEIENADTTINIKMIDTANGSYAIFAFQQQHFAEAKKLKEGDNVVIKGSCSGGAYSQILETEFITFKRCALSK